MPNFGIDKVYKKFFVQILNMRVITLNFGEFLLIFLKVSCSYKENWKNFRSKENDKTFCWSWNQMYCETFCNVSRSSHSDFNIARRPARCLATGRIWRLARDVTWRPARRLETSWKFRMVIDLAKICSLAEMMSTMSI